MIYIDHITLALVCAIFFSLGIAAACLSILYANRDRPAR